MSQSIGYIKEKIGRSVYKGMVLRPVGKKEKTKVVSYKKQTVPLLDENNQPTGQTTEIEVPDVTEKAYVPVYRVVFQHYFNPAEKFFRHKKEKMTYKIDLANEVYNRGEVHLFFFEYATGKPLDMSGCVLVEENALDLDLAFDTEHIKRWKEGNSGMNAGWLILGLMLTVGLVVGFLLGSNIDNITAAVGSIGSAPTPAPVVVVP